MGYILYYCILEHDQNTFFMKKLNFLVAALIFSGIFLMSCGGSSGGEKQSEEELQIERLAKSWGLSGTSTVFRDNDNITAEYNGFRLTLSSSFTYTISGDANEIFARTSGSWDFPRNSANEPTNLGQILIDGDTRPLTVVVDADGTVLDINFSISNGTPIGGRVQGVDGDYIFSDLVPQ